MSFKDCLQGKINDKLITKGEADKILASYDALVKKYVQSMGSLDAANKAAADVAHLETKRLLEKKRNLIKAAQYRVGVVNELNAKVGLPPLEATGKGKPGGVPPDYKKGSFSRAVRDFYETVMHRADTINESNLKYLDAYVEKFRSKLAGTVQEVDNIIPVVRAAFGDAVGDGDASAMGMGLRKSFDLAAKRFRAAGGVMGEISNYFPQRHNIDLVKGSSFEEWSAALYARLDIDKMIDWETGLPFTEQRLMKAMRDDFDNIVSDGRADQWKALQKGKLKVHKGADIAERRQASRFYRFKSSDDFLEYNRQFGVGDAGLFDLTMEYFRGISRDTALLEKMGPKADGLAGHLDDRIAALDGGSNFTTGMYNVLNGSTDTSRGESWWSNMIRGTGNLVRSAVLGGASISALGDAYFIRLSAKMNGLPEMETMGHYLALLNPADPSHRELARQLGFVADWANAQVLGDMRMTGMSGGDVPSSPADFLKPSGMSATKKYRSATAWMASFTNKASGLSRMTSAGKDAVSLALSSTLAKVRSLEFGALDKDLAGSMEAHGITADDWNIIRLAAPSRHNGMQFIRGEDILRMGSVEPKIRIELANKLDDWHSAVRTKAVNEPSLKTRAITTGAAFGGDASTDSLLRNITSSATMFLSFPITVTQNFVAPAFMKDTHMGRVQAISSLLLFTTMLGAVAIQAKEVSQGRTVRPVDNPKFWMAAALQGGGLGPVGDFLFSDTNRFGRKDVMAFPGPVGGLISDAKALSVGNVQKLITGQETSFLKDSFNLVKRNTPAHTLWYARLAFDRLFFDQLEHLIDPEYYQHRTRAERKRLEEQGNSFWWRPGEALPNVGR